MTTETQALYEALEAAYPDAHCELVHRTPLQLLAATVMSAQTTDKQVNKVTEVLYAKYPTLEDLLTLSVEDLENAIRSIGFYHTKAKNLYLMFREIAGRFGGEVPDTMEELTSLPGVGRKTANVVLANAFGKPAIAVDTHVLRVSNRLGLVKASMPEEAERQLMAVLDESLWSRMHHLLIFHGRRCCHARGPACSTCPVSSMCALYQAEKENRHDDT